MSNSFQKTRMACYLGYVTQAVVGNFLPLLFLTFQRQFGIDAEKITALIAVNFVTQILIDFISAPIVKRVGCRGTMLFGCACTTIGFVMLSFLPFMIPPFLGLCICTICNAIGGGVIEVLVSPIMESCPSANKTGQMNLLHSFYCYGSAFCVLVSTLFFFLFGTQNWRVLTLLWAFVPVMSFLLFLKVPLCPLEEESTGDSQKHLFANSIFWLMLLMMLCAGASELAVSQWASAFAESALGVAKSVGDLAGPFAFAMLMGIARTLSVKVTDKKLMPTMLFSCLLCIVGYGMIAQPVSSALSLAGCGVCGFSVAIMWPGTFSIAARQLPKGGTTMFALLALAGDLGCTAGPMVVGLSETLTNGFVMAAGFPLLLLFCLVICMWHTKRKKLF